MQTGIGLMELMVGIQIWWRGKKDEAHHISVHESKDSVALSTIFNVICDVYTS